MKKIFITLFLILSVFSIVNAKTFKTEKELNDFFIQVDKKIKEEVKKNYREEYNKIKTLSNNGYSFKIEDDGTTLITKNIDLKPKTEITQYFNKKGELYMISSLTSETDKELYALYRKYDKNGNLSIYTYAIDGKNTDKGYYSDGKLAYIREFKILKGETPIPNGKYIEYYKNTKIKVQGNYKDGKRNGEFKTFLKNGKSAGSVIYKDDKITKSTLANSMKDNASFSILTDVNYNINSHKIVTEEFPNGLLKQYFIFNKDGLLDGENREYYEEGEIKSIFPFKNNVADGNMISYYQNGNIKEKNTYKNGIEEGESILYYENGNLKEKYFMKNEKLDGEAVAYYEDGKIRNKSIFKDGVKLEEEIYKDNEIIKNIFKNNKIVQQDTYSENGILKEKKHTLNNGNMEYISYYKNKNIKQKVLLKDETILKDEFFSENGNIRKNSFLLDGKTITELFEYYPNGKLFRKISTVNEIPNGDLIEYYPNGNMKTKAHYINGKLNGELIVYFENGNIKEKAFTIGENLIGDAFEYYPSGKLKYKSFFKDGKREGESLSYYESGNLKQKVLYKNDVKNGNAMKFYENGVVKEKAYFVDDKQENEDLYYDEKGNLIKTDIYKNGVKQ
ncbi:toxin-antitoxin system YwqK family antitoxin [Fusobacterium sp. 1001295B_180824_G3]|uniref:toxin-antitoxin system YwqK family antitoxin n=1 Tax=Fusobacterium sp. 1001295B_180824_G3 TaxID=2787123 RepID=UPI0018971441|nr:toxin-antitoxin system YwqK family antitoxin [Fusobacterium sp. 1001295B_180824_G3]